MGVEVRLGVKYREVAWRLDFQSNEPIKSDAKQLFPSASLKKMSGYRCLEILTSTTVVPSHCKCQAEHRAETISFTVFASVSPLLIVIRPIPSFQLRKIPSLGSVVNKKGGRDQASLSLLGFWASFSFKICWYICTKSRNGIPLFLGAPLYARCFRINKVWSQSISSSSCQCLSVASLAVIKKNFFNVFKRWSGSVPWALLKQQIRQLIYR